MDDLWDFNIVSLPDDSSQQPRTADFQARESRSSCSKTAISAAAKVKETISGQTSVQQPKPSTIESASSSPDATHDTTKQSSNLCGILRERNGIMPKSSRKRARFSLEPQLSARAKRVKKDDKTDFAEIEMRGSDKILENFSNIFKAQIAPIKVKLAQQPRPLTEYMSARDGWISYWAEIFSHYARKSDMTATEFRAVEYAIKIRFLETLSLKMLEATSSLDEDTEILRKAFMHKKRTEKS